jgi:hypothetical protein
MKLNKNELEALAWKVRDDLQKERDAILEARRKKVRDQFLLNPELVAAKALLEANSKKYNYELDFTFKGKLPPHVPGHYDILNKLIIQQIVSSSITQVLDDVKQEIRDEIDLK